MQFFKTIRKPREGWFRYYRNFGGRGWYGPLRYRLLPEPSVESVEVAAVRDATSQFFWAVEQFFSNIKAGIQSAVNDYREDGKWLAGVRVEILDMKVHDVDTHAEGMRNEGYLFVVEAIDCLADPIIPVSPEALSSTVVALSQGIAADAAFDRLPILADALQDSGCDDPLVLDHLRTCRDHTPSCWVVEMILNATR